MQEKGENKMGIWDDIKKGLKGSKEYQEAKAKKKAKKTKVKAKKASPKKVSKAKKDAANKSWAKATKSAKASGVKLTDLIKKRKGLKKGTAAYAKVQNQINKHYGVKKRHKAKSSGVGRLDRDKVAGKFEDKRPVKITAKTDARPKKKVTRTKITKDTERAKLDKMKKDASKKADKGKVTKKAGKAMTHEEYYKKYKAKDKATVAGPDYKTNPDLIAGPKKDEEKMEQGGMVNDMRPKYKGGGKVEGGGLFDFPASNAQDRNK